MTHDMHELHPVTVVSLTQQDDQGNIAVVLQDDLDRELIIPIGACGAQAIMLALKQVRIDRPLTHELLLTLATDLDATVDRLVIDDLSKGIYFARLVLQTPQGLVSLDCRPSDGIAVALRADAPLFATEAVIEGEGGLEE